MKIKKSSRMISFLLAFVLLTISFTGYYTHTVYGNEQAHIDDVIELQVNDQERQYMKPYANACYESSFTTAEGANRYRIIKNGTVLEERVVDTYPDTFVTVRYFPYREKKVTDSVNESSMFKPDGAWVGELTKLNMVRPADAPFKDWYPEDESGLMDYVGGGIYQKTYEFTAPLPEDVTLDYKIAFGKSWDIPTIGDKFSENLKMTIPAGTQAVSVWADSIGMRCVTSVELGGFQGTAEQDPEGSLRQKPEGGVSVSLIGSFNSGSDTDGAWELKPVGGGLYGQSFPMSQGQISYNCLFDGQFTRSGGANTISLRQDRYVYFLYNSATNQLYDSVNHSGEIEALLNFQRPLTPEELDQQAYRGDDLGAVYSPESTQFKVWAPTASAVSVNLYSTGGAGENSLIQNQPMIPGQNGIWSATIPGDLNGVFYTYLVTAGSETNETADIYAKAVGLNGDRGMIIDLDSTDPEGWGSDSFVSRTSSTDAIIWETHVRDFSISSDSGIRNEYKGKYLAFTEHGTTVNGEGKLPTGIDYLKTLGVNYIHLLPTQDFVNNELDASYNWGYSTKNYHVPEGSYSTDPSNGYTRIREFKQMVQSLHQADIGVVMDVVYNHTGETEGSWFNLTVPGYYYRLDENGDFKDRTLCGNETASERAMFRKYMVDSLLYWAKEYHVDGFRFDLMAIHDTETMNTIRRALDQAGLSNVILYGEPWYATDNDSDLAPGYLASSKKHAQALDDRIALFNSYTRTGIIGGLDGSGTGFVQGGIPAVTAPIAEGSDSSLMSAVAASSDPARGTDSSPAWSRNPSQSLSYTSCHDDCTLWDWLYNSIYGTPANTVDYGKRDDTMVRMNKMAALINLTSQGSVLFQAGEEFARTKNGDSDSYQSADSVNAIRWSRLGQFQDLYQYYQGLIAIRKQFVAFRDATTASLQTIRTAEEDQNYLIAYTIQNQQTDAAWKTAAVIVNSGFQEQTVDLQVKEGAASGSWAVIADRERAGTETIEMIYGNRITVPAQTGMILVCTGQADEAAAPLSDDTAFAASNGAAEASEEEENESQRGRKKTADGMRFYDEDGKPLTGWVVYDKDSKTAERFDGVISSENVYYCDSDGYCLSGWQNLWPPVYETEDGLDANAIVDDDAEMEWYYFKDNGRLCRNEKREIDGAEYCFDDQGRRISGWIYQLQEGDSRSYVRVDSDTPVELRNEYNQDYSHYMYASTYDGKLAKNQWLYLIYPGQEEELNLDDDGRSFYFRGNGFLETGKDAIVKTAITIDELGTYKLRDYSQQMSIIKIDDDYYALDNVMGSIGDVVYLTGGSQRLPDGFYCFKGENNKMITGNVLLKEDEDDCSYYYRFAPEGTDGYRKGQGVTGVYGGKLYYQGLSVGAQEDGEYEVVYLPTLAAKQTGATGMFLVDERGTVKTGSHVKDSSDREFKVRKKSGTDDAYGYEIYEIFETEEGKDMEKLLTVEDASRIYLDDIER